MKTEQIKRIKLFGIFIILLVAAQSCVVSSLHPLYTDDSRVHLDELNGVWVNKEGAIYQITTIIDSSGLEKTVENKNIKYQSGNDISFSVKERNKLFDERMKAYADNPALRKYYQIKFIEKDTCVLDGVLSKLGEHYFIDVIPNENDLGNRLGEDYEARALIVANHAILKLYFEEDQIRLNAIEFDVFEDLLKEKKIRIEHVERDDKLIITAKTPEIQKFLIKFADTEIFNDPDEALMLKRIK
jgi:hypothetical protein